MVPARRGRRPASGCRRVRTDTPAPVVDTLARALADARRADETRRQLAAQGYGPLDLTAAELRALIERETASFRGVIESLSVRGPP